MGIKKFLLFLFLGGFLYHLTSFIIDVGFEKLFHSPTGIHFISFIVTGILFVICYKIINRKRKTSDENHHKINKIRE